MRRDVLPGDHSAMCKFSSREAVGYQRTLAHIRRLVMACKEKNNHLQPSPAVPSVDRPPVSPLRQLAIEAPMQSESFSDFVRTEDPTSLYQ